MLTVVTGRNNTALLRPCTLPFQSPQIMPSTFDSEVILEVCPADNWYDSKDAD